MKQVGDLYWNQLSMWEFSSKDYIDIYNDNGFHYELLIITDVIGENHYKYRYIERGEITEEYLKSLIPEKGHNWSRCMGNRVDLV